MKKKIIAIVGTTASGKSDLGLKLASHFQGEIVSADSRQIYRGLNLGTGKETVEELNIVPHHMIDIIEPNTPFSLAEYQREAYKAIEKILSKNKLPFIVGGTGLYIRSIIEGYQLNDATPNDALRKELESKTKDELLALLENKYGIIEENPSASPRRLIRRIEIAEAGYDDIIKNQPRYDSLQLGLTYPRDILLRRTEERLDKRIEQGMIDEVKQLIDSGASIEFMEGLGLEYRYTTQYLNGLFTGYNEYHEKLFIAIRQFAKRQMTWFKKDNAIHWLDLSKDYQKEAIELITNFIEKT